MSNEIKSLKSKIEKLNARVSELEAHETQLELVIEATGVGIWDWYVQTGETVFNERWANIIGYTLKEISPVSIETWMRFAHPDDLKESERLLNEHWEGRSDYYLCESRMKHREGHWVWVYDTGKVIEWETDGVPKRMIGTHLDITEQKSTQLLLDKANKKLEKLVRVDPLSQIANRRAYDEKLEFELAASRRQKKPLSLLMIDIDFFKNYNDRYGHESGDIVIQHVAKMLKSVLRRKTDFVARYGGEEFVILLPSSTSKEATLMCQNIMKGVAALKIEHEDSPFKKLLTVSVGVATTETEVENLLQRADEALYSAKQNGRNQFQFHGEK